MHMKYFREKFDIIGFHKRDRFSFSEIARGDINGDADMPAGPTSEILKGVQNFVSGSGYVQSNLSSVLSGFNPKQLKMLECSLETGRPFVKNLPFFRIFITGRPVSIMIGDDHNNLVGILMDSIGLQELSHNIFKGSGALTPYGFRDDQDDLCRGEVSFVYDGARLSVQSGGREYIPIPLSVLEYNEAILFMQQWAK